MRFSCIFSAVPLICLVSAAAVAETLEDYRGEKRPLVIFTPSAVDDRYDRQLQILLRNSVEARERDLLPVEVVGVEPVRVEALTEPDMNAVALRERFAAAEDGFKVVLIGKDGTVKLTSTTPIDAETLFRTIDAMPMRQREMRDRN